MDKEEIMARSRQENRGGDERKRVFSEKADSYGVVGMGIMFLILIVVKLVKTREIWQIYDLLALWFSFFATSDAVQYRLLREKRKLYAAIGYTCAAAAFLAVYIWKG